MAIASWLTPASKSGTGNKTVGLTASKNPGASRTTIVTVTISGITKTINCTQTEQDKFTLKVSSTTLNSSGTAIINIGECSIGSASNAGVTQGTYYRDTSQTITAKAAPTGYNFVGWYEGSNLISSSLQVSITMNANRTLVAKYQIKTYAVNAVSEDINKGTVSPVGQTIEHGKNATVTASPKAAYNFAGWYNGTTRVSTNTSYTFAVTSNISLTAKFTIKTFTTTTANTTGGTASVNKSSVSYGDSAIWTATPNTGYHFTKWSNDATANPLTVSNITANTHITPVFTINTYRVTWNVNGGNALDPAYVNKTHGATLGTLPTPTRNSTAEYSYTFAGWFTAASGGTQITASTTVIKDVTYYAHWTATKRSYTATFNGNGGGTPNPSTITKEYNTALGTLPTCTRTGYTFLGWYTASSGGTKISTTTVVTKDITYYAQWSINSYTLTFNPNGGTVTPTSKNLEYNSAYGTLPTPTRVSDAQYTYTFAGWYTAATGGTQVTTATKMAAKDTTVYAHWTSNTRSYTVSYQTTYGTLNKTSQSVTYNSKGSCTLTMPDNTAEFTYTFVGWYTAANGGGTKVGSELTLETPAIKGTVTYYAYVTRSTKSYTHTFNANGGGTVSPATITKAYNTALGTLPTVSRTGYTFVGWFDTSAASGGTQATTATKVTGAKTWYARWSINSYTFTFNANGGNTPSSASITKTYNSEVGTLPTCTRNADNTYTYAFAGWFDTSASSGGTQLTTTSKITSNKTWYARWTPTYKNYTVTWNGNGGTPSKTSSSFHYNDALSTLPTATRTGYTFNGWSTSKTGTVNVTTSTKVTANVTYYAIWTIKSFTVTLKANGGTFGTANGWTISSDKTTATKTLNYGAVYGTLPTISRTATNQYTYSFKAYSPSCTTTTTIGAANAEHTAQWDSTAVKYTLTLNPNGGSVSPTSMSFAWNAALTGLPTPTREATNAYTYSFRGWFTASSGGTQITSSITMGTAARTIYAQWDVTEKRYSVTGSPFYRTTDGTGNYTSGTTGGTVSGSNNSVLGGNNVTLTATPATGYQFDGWYTAGASGGTRVSTSASYTISTVTSNHTYYARFTKKYYTITYSKGANVASLSKTSERVAHGANASGSTMTVNTTTASTSYAVDGWYNSGGSRVTTSATYAPTNVTAAATYTAKGTATTRSYTLTVNSNNTNYGTVSGGGTYTYNTKVTIKATAKSGYHFVKWSDGSTDATREVTVTGAATYTATFAADPYLNLDKTSLEFEASGGTQTVNVTSNVSWTVS